MKNQTLTAIRIALPLALATAALGQQSLSNYYTFMTLDYPNSTFSFPLGMNNLRQIAGTFGDVEGNNHGYLWTAGAFTQIDYPGAAPGPFGGTTAGGVNDRGDVVGLYFDASYFQHGYVLARPEWCLAESAEPGCKAVFTKFDFPGAAQIPGVVFETGPGLGTAGIGINDEGSVTGLYATHGEYSNGFLMSNGAFTAIDNPLSSHAPGNGTKCFTVSNAGAMACDYITQMVPSAPQITHGFLRVGTKDTPIEFPGSEQGGFGTQVSGVNIFQTVVGTFLTPAGALSSLMWVDGHFYSVNFPGMPYNELHSINDRGDLTGAYSPDPAGSVLHGYVAFPKL